MTKIKINKKGLLLTAIILVVIIGINFFASYIIKQKITDLLLKNESEYYAASVDNVQFKLIQKSITFNSVLLTPTKESIAKLIDESSKKEILGNIVLSAIKLDGIGYIDLLFNHKINVNSIILNDLSITDFQNSEIVEKKEVKKPLDIDSIFLKKLDGLAIDNIIFNNFNYQVYDFALNKVTFQSLPISFNSTGIKLEKYADHLFKLRPSKDQFEIKDIKLDLNESNYYFNVESFYFDFKNDYIEIKKIDIRPQIDTYELAKTYVYNSDIFKINVDNLKIYNFNLSKLIKSEGLFVDSLVISNLKLNLFKDKRKPFDITKRPGLPHIGLKRMKFPLSIKKVLIEESEVVIQERMEGIDILMEVPISEFNAEINNITSIKSLREEPLRVVISGKLMQEGEVNVNATFPLKDNQNTFYFNGSLGRSEMKVFDTAIYPVLGLKVFKGTIDNLSFSARANEFESNGKMTLLYHDLEADVFKPGGKKEKKFMSWTVNTLIHKSNPKKNRKEREVVMHFERVKSKGLGNYFWKTLQSGLINTIVPGGKKTKSSKKQGN